MLLAIEEENLIPKEPNAARRRIWSCIGGILSFAFLVAVVTYYTSSVKPVAGAINNPQLLVDTSVDWVTWITVMGDDYKPILQCWERWFLEARTASNLVVVCLTESLCRQLRSWKSEHEQLAGLSFANDVTIDTAIELPGVALAPYSATPRKLWPPSKYIRMFYGELQMIMESTGSSVLHSDVDAFWVNSPDAVLKRIISERPDVDIIASHHSEPVPALVEVYWGFVLNMGFVMFRNTNATKKLIAHLGALPGNDQEKLNNYLYDIGCNWSLDGVLKVARCGKQQLQVVALPYNQFSRELLEVNATSRSDLMVLHPDTGAMDLYSVGDRMSEYSDRNLCAQNEVDTLET